jgi:type I restriction-modification system DNA methylase subunit
VSKETGSDLDYHAQGVLYLPASARFSTLQKLPEGEDLGKAVNAAMKAIEAENEDLKDILPKTFALARVVQHVISFRLRD